MCTSPVEREDWVKHGTPLWFSTHSMLLPAENPLSRRECVDALLHYTHTQSTSTATQLAY